MDKLTIERKGGIGGFGQGNSPVKSSGELDLSSLSAAQKTHIEALFANPGAHQGTGKVSHSFRYCLSRKAGGKEQSVEVDESAVPEWISRVVTDRL
jgi:hypothetical protein